MTFNRVKQPARGDQLDVAVASRAGGEPMHEVVLVITRAVADLRRNFERQTKSRRDLIANGQIESTDVSIRIKGWIRWIRQLLVAVKFTEGMKPAIGDTCRPLLRLKVRRLLGKPGNAARTDGSQTGRQ